MVHLLVLDYISHEHLVVGDSLPFEATQGSMPTRSGACGALSLPDPVAGGGCLASPFPDVLQV